MFSSLRSMTWCDGVYWGLGLLTVALYLAWPLMHLEAYAWSNDEGLYVQRAALANAGYPLYTETFFNKPPLLVWILQVAFQLLGESIAVARLTCLGLSLLGFLALGCISRQLWGKWAGLAAMLIFLGIPEVPARAHAVMSDLPAMAFALFAMAAALAFRRQGGRIWIALCSAAYAGALLIHPLLIYMAIPLAVILFWPGKGFRSQLQWRDTILFLAVGLSLGLLILALIDRQAFFTWGVRYNVGTIDESLRHSAIGGDWRRMLAYLAERWTLLLLTAIGLIALGVKRTCWDGLLVTIVWFAVTIATFLLWSPIWAHYMLFLILPLITIAGGGLRIVSLWLVETCRDKERRPWGRMGLAAVALVGGLVFIIHRAGEKMPQLESGPNWSADQMAARAFLRENVPPDSFVAADDPLLAFAAGRLVPPPLTGASHKRIRSGYLTSEDMIATVLHYRVPVVLFATGRLEQLSDFEAWVITWAAERSDFGAMWAYQLQAFPPVPQDPVAQLGDGIMLHGYDLAHDDLHPGDTLTVTLFWERNGPISEDYTLFLHLVDDGGTVWAQYDGPPMEGRYPTSHWPQGMTLLGRCAFTIDPDTPPGEYRLLAGMYSWPSLVRLPASRPDGSRWADDLTLLTEVTLSGP